MSARRAWRAAAYLPGEERVRVGRVAAFTTEAAAMSWARAAVQAGLVVCVWEILALKLGAPSAPATVSR